jgi:inner membrane protein
MDDVVARVLNGQTLRFTAVGTLVLVMLIPLAFVQGVTEERQRYFDEAAADIATAWGGPQALAGPFLVVPEMRRAGSVVDAGDPGRQERRQMRVLLPRSLDVSVEVRHQTRARGIYQVPVYQAMVTFSGTFLVPDPDADVRRLADEARLLVGITDTHAVEAMSELELAGATAPFTASTGQAWLGQGVHADTVFPTPGVPTRFAFQVTLRGSGTLGVAPVGAISEISMTSSWPHPSFTGRFLPSEHEIGPQGFSARWVVQEFARRLPVSWIQDSDEISLEDGYAVVSLFQPVTGYTRVDRGIKYGVLFIGLTYLTFICFEMLTAVRFHYVQYAVVGAGLVLFYLALLSLSEALPFPAAYVIAALLLGSLVTWYVWMITRRLPLSAGVLGILIALYLCLYVLLELEAYALLVGTGVLFVGLFALMYATSRLDDAAIPPTPAGPAGEREAAAGGP